LTTPTSADDPGHLVLGQDTEPEPDIALRNGTTSHPTTAVRTLMTLAPKTGRVILPNGREQDLKPARIDPATGCG